MTYIEDSFAQLLNIISNLTLIKYFRYIESRKNKGLIQINEIEIKRWMSNENPMFEVYKTMADIFEPLKNAQYDLKLFKILKEIITELVVVKPEKRMKLQDAREKLEELDQFATTKDFNYLLINSFIQTENDQTMTNTDETTQNSLGLMDEIRFTRLFTTEESSEDDKKFTQRNTNLCVSVSAMRLLSYALVEFLENNFRNTGDGKTLKDLTDEILKYSVKPTQVEREPCFIHKLVTICCGVISPRSLHGLNHCHLDDDFQTAAQEQNIRK